MSKQYNIIRPAGLKPMPDKFEEMVAEICALYFKSDVAFVLRGNHTTPDLKVLKTGQFWEIKNIKGNSKHTIEDNLRKADKQSKNVVISLLRASKADVRRTKTRIEYMLSHTKVKFDGVILITKAKEVIDIK